MKRTTIKDISNISGFSIATVSLSLNNSSKVTDETKEHVMNVARQLNYVKNQSASNLRNKKQKNICIFQHEYNSNDATQEIIFRVTSQLQEEYCIQFYSYSRKNISYLLKIAESNGCDKCILFMPHNNFLFLPNTIMSIITINNIGKYDSRLSSIFFNFRLMVELALDRINSLNFQTVYVLDRESILPISNKLINAIIKNKIINMNNIETVFFERLQNIESDFLLQNNINFETSAFISTHLDLLKTLHIKIKNNFSSGIKQVSSQFIFMNILNNKNIDISNLVELSFDYKLLSNQLVRLIKSEQSIAEYISLSPALTEHI